MMYPDDTCVRIPQDLIIEQVDDEALVLDMSGNVFFSLNPVALAMMTSLREGKTLGEVAHSVGAEYDAPADHIRQDLESFVQDLLERNLASVDL